jgi:hypothetical protein
MRGPSLLCCTAGTWLATITGHRCTLIYAGKKWRNALSLFKQTSPKKEFLISDLCRASDCAFNWRLQCIVLLIFRNQAVSQN